MRGPYTLHVGTPGGDGEVGVFADPYEALRERDERQAKVGSRIRPYYVVSDDTDPPESGEVEWCEDCGSTAVLKSHGVCNDCATDDKDWIQESIRARAEAEKFGLDPDEVQANYLRANVQAEIERAVVRLDNYHEKGPKQVGRALDGTDNFGQLNGLRALLAPGSENGVKARRVKVDARFDQIGLHMARQIPQRLLSFTDIEREPWVSRKSVA